MKRWIIVVGLSVLYLGVRLWHFEEAMTFHLDQGLHLLEAKDMVDSGKIRLIGPMVSSKTFLDRGFFIGPQYYYVLAVLGILTSWNALAITIILLVVEFGAVLLLIRWIKRKFSFEIAMIVMALVTLSPYLIIHSRFIWNPHFLWPLGTVGLITAEKAIKNKKWWVVLGILWGVAFGFHYSAVLWMFWVAIFWWKQKNRKLTDWLIMGVGVGLGNLPYWLFELRHSLYNLKTLGWVISNSNGGFRLEPHYVIYPLLPLFVYLLIEWLKIKPNKVLIIVVGLMLVIGQSLIFRDRLPLGHPPGWNLLIERLVVNKILDKGCPKNYNVASTVSGDTRAYDLRFLLTARGCPPMGVTEYPRAEKLFLVAPPTRPPENEEVWEVNSLGKIKVVERLVINDKVVFYELEKN
ncbi:MAG: hypothetical protein WCV93_00695 [Candidatus Shapirobacteria bacterium]|jgi:hypothetical protein